MTKPRVYLSPPDVGEAEKKLVMEALDSGWVAPLGPFVDKFEASLQQITGRSFAVALASGTSALHLGLLAIGVRPGDIVICPSLTFVATANAIRYVGGSPMFVDSDASGNMSAQLLEQAIWSCKSDGARVAAIVPVDFLGKSADYTAICQIAEDNGIPIISDGAESLGSTHRLMPAASYGLGSAVSFNGNKIITTSGGGMFLTDDRAVAERVRFLATQARDKAVHYQHSEMGFNYRMSNILAAIGVAQVGRLARVVEIRRETRFRYSQLFSEVAGVSVFGGEWTEDNCWLTAIHVTPQVSGWTASELLDHLEKRNIEGRPLWKPMHLQPLYAGSKSVIDGTGESIFQNSIALPSGTHLAEWGFDLVEDAIKDFLISRGV